MVFYSYKPKNFFWMIDREIVKIGYCPLLYRTTDSRMVENSLTTPITVSDTPQFVLLEFSSALNLIPILIHLPG